MRNNLIAWEHFNKQWLVNDSTRKWLKKKLVKFNEINCPYCGKKKVWKLDVCYCINCKTEFILTKVER